MATQTFQGDAGFFYCPIPSAIHPKVDEIASRSIEWMTRFGLCADERRRAAIIGTNAAEWYCRCTPDAIEERLQIAADWMYWAFDFDDVWCDGDKAMEQAGEFVPLAGRLLRILESGDARLCGDDPHLAAIHDIIVRYSECASPAQMRRLIEGHRNWLFGVAQRQSFGVRGVKPDLDEYVILRLGDSGIPVCTAMFDIVDGMEVPDHEMDSLAVRALTEASWLLVAWDNDICSRPKEVNGWSDKQNFIDIQVREQRCSEEQALREVLAKRNRIMHLFIRLYEQTMAEASPALRRYLTDFACMVRGNIDWSLRVPRYNTIYDSDDLSPIATVGLSSGWTTEPSDPSLEPPLLTIVWWWDQLRR
jgi:Terpene synthase family 2, C-terminal metal binding